MSWTDQAEPGQRVPLVVGPFEAQHLAKMETQPLAAVLRHAPCACLILWPGQPRLQLQDGMAAYCDIQTRLDLKRRGERADAVQPARPAKVGKPAVPVVKHSPVLRPCRLHIY